MRRVILALVAAGLAVVVWLLWPDAAENETPEPEAAVSTTTTSTEPAPTTTVEETTTTTGPETHVVETVEEAEEILRQLWFGWFEGIYNQDEERIREVVGNPSLIEAAVAQFGGMEFHSVPQPSSIELDSTAVLHSDEHCLAIWADVDASALIGETNDGVHVFIYQDGWFFISQWAERNDLWVNDCESQL